jgi:hypothetical protein
MLECVEDQRRDVAEMVNARVEAEVCHERTSALRGREH